MTPQERTAIESRLPGSVLYLDRAASVQFARNPIYVRVIRVHDWSTTTDLFLWIDCYQLDSRTLTVATERRSLFVQYAGLKFIREETFGAHQVRPSGVPRPRSAELPARASQ